MRQKWPFLGREVGSFEYGGFGKGIGPRIPQKRLRIDSEGFFWRTPPPHRLSCENAIQGILGTYFGQTRGGLPMSALSRALTLGALLALAVIPTHVVMAAECGFVTIEVRPLTECEWQRLSPIPGNEHVCEPVTLIGTAGPDQLYGNGGNDVLIGGRGKDVLRGDGGDDVLRGGRGSDELNGGPGRDELYGGRGDDTLTGSHGADRFVFSPGAKGDKIITDFDPCAGDRIVLYSNRPGRWPSVADILASEVQEPGGYTVYTLRRGLTVETNVPLEAGDFVVKEGNVVVE